MQWWTAKKLHEFQWGELHKLLDHAYTQVPFWKGVFDKLGLRLSDIKTYEDVRKLPIIDKDMIQFKVVVPQPSNQSFQIDYVIPKSIYQDKVEAIESSIGSLLKL